MSATDRRRITLAPYGIAESAAIAAAFAQVHPTARPAYIRRRAYQATRAAWPTLTAGTAYALARSAQAAAVRFHSLALAHA
jgi:hypothetical protein